MTKFTVFFEQVNRTNFQIIADTQEEAEEKAEKLYRKWRELPSLFVQEGWIAESDGEDK